MTGVQTCALPIYARMMQQALDNAKKTQGFCAPNPAVGAVLVRNGKMIAAGYHRGPGSAHAEVDALRATEETELRDCDLYVTLEPCCHYGRTPPCTNLIIQKKLRHVYFGFLDPNPKIAGRGQQQLRDAGVLCDHINIPAIDNFYQPYQFWWQHKKPHVTLKLAITEDRCIAIAPTTGHECQQDTHHYRLTHDALLTTINTIIHDDPQFNARLMNLKIKKPLYILDSHARLALNARVLETCHPITIFHAPTADQQRLHLLTQKGIRTIAVPTCIEGLDLNVCLEHIHLDGKHTLWIEAGWTCFQSFVKNGFAERIIIYIASQHNKTIAHPFTFYYEPGQPRDIKIELLGRDVKLMFY